MTYDIIIKKGKLVDGTGSPWRNTDIGISGDSIASIEIGRASCRERV